ncbi:uncharacterized protein LOC123902883 [Trifolium pratense]|uniref:uncharacterized protein LOC123902883 n=1 Tax=Trifolium pratense TaxID=57577 RepID=UPI001E6924D4|nr:uncharacterized protein LOC123902883 [Trifolium pratense]
MKHALIKVNHCDSHTTENSKSLNHDDKLIRLERRWRRREARNDSLQNNYVASATRTTTKICENTSVSIDKNNHMIDDEIDEDWAKYLATYTGDDDDEVDSDYEADLATYNDDIEADSTSNQSRDNEVDPDYGAYLANSNLDIGADRASNQSRDSDEVDPDYGTYLANSNLDIGADRASNQSHDSDEVDPDYGTYLATYNPEIEADSATSNQSGDSDEVDPDYASYLATLNPDFEIDCASSHSDGSNIDADFGNNSVSEEIEEVEDDQLLRKRSSVRRNSLVSDQAFDNPKVQDNVDEDYEALLNAVTIVDDEEEYFRVKNPTNTPNVEDRSNSSDSDLIVMDSIPICENTPFISSKAYDLSCLREEMNPDNMDYNMQISACYDSQFRRSLMECLDKPYDQEEYDRRMHDISKRHLKERHVETRQGVVKSYHSKGVSNSYLDWYPDLDKAITEFKEEQRVLFLLRGFFFWNTHVNHPGRFQPWLDKRCLEKLRKM